MIISRLTTTERDNLTPSPIGGYVIYNTTTDKYQVYNFLLFVWEDVRTSLNPPIFLDQTSTIADFQTGNIYYYVGTAPITYDYDLLPYPTPTPVSGFDFVNLSVYDVTFNSAFGNITYVLTPNQRLRDVQIVDNGQWEVIPTEYFDNIYDLQQVTNKGAATTNAIIVRNNPDNYRTRYSIIGQQIQYDVGGRNVDYTYNRIQVNKPSNLASWTLNFPDIDSNTPLTNTIVDFRPDVSGTVAYLSDIPTITNLYNSDGVLTSNRYVDLNAKELTFASSFNNGVITQEIIQYLNYDLYSLSVNNYSLNTLIQMSVSSLLLKARDTSQPTNETSVELTQNAGIKVIDSLSNIGLIGNADYSANYTNNSYVQKKYVDDINLNNIVQNGNSFGTTITIGTNDAFNLSFETNGVTKATFDLDGGIQLFNLAADRYALTVTNTVDDNNYTKFTGSTVEYLLGFQSTRFLVKNNTTNQDLISFAHGSNALTLGSTTPSQNVINLPNSNAGYSNSSIGLNSSRKFYYTDGTTVRFFIRTTNQLATDTANYETLVTNNNDIPNKKYVDDKVNVKSVRTTAVNTSITSSDYTLVCTNSVTVTLPAANTVTGYIFNIKNRAGLLSTVTVDADASETIDGNLTVNVGQDNNLTIQSTGTEWIIL